jgi:hypothetical protein
MEPSQHETKMLMISDLEVKYDGILIGHLPKKCEICIQFMSLATAKNYSNKTLLTCNSHKDCLAMLTIAGGGEVED